MTKTEFPGSSQRTVSKGAWFNTPKDQGSVQDTHRDHDRHNNARHKPKYGVGVWEGHDGQTDVLREE